MRKTLIMIGLGLVALFLLWSAISIYPEWLWFKNLGFFPVFWTILLSKFLFGFLVWVVLVIIVVLNLYAAKRLYPDQGQGIAFKPIEGYTGQIGLSGRTLNTLLLAFILILSFVVATKGSYQWDMVLRYLHWKPVGSADPIFHKDIGFYLFTLPLVMYIRYGLLVLVVLAGLITTGWYLKNGALKLEGDLAPGGGAPAAFPEVTMAPQAKKHLIFLAGIIVLLLAWGYHLKVYGLLYSTQGPAFGASYTDVHVRILANRALILLSLVFSGILFYSAFRFKKKLIWTSFAAWVGTVLVLGTGIPILVQKFVVKPNELAKETPYIAYNIDFTRKAYNLNRIKVVNFEVKEELRAEDIAKDDATIQNIRIWDERPLLQTYRQIQSIRLYYDFNNVDVDRYYINDQYRQLMLAARELVVNQLPPQANTWVNRHLIYTHGYGLAASPVNEVTSEGLPRLFIKDVPPSSEPDLKITRPEIYYGEKTEEYVLVKTKTQEFDYPKGDKNVYTSYQGKGGVPITSFWRRLLFAIEFMDPQILFTTSLAPDSRIMYNRRIGNRCRLLAPFLDYDKDPYMVVSGGRLFWIQDAYTTSDMYPYSRRTYGRFGKKGVNYIRNSVKVVVDAYHGDVTFYVMDTTDPIVRTYASIFPDLFKPFKAMPADLKRHIRYPKDLFHIQASTYTRYHMEDVQVFYNQEDLWQVPDELYGEGRQEMEPYYIIIKLPEEEKEEFLLMLPFTPAKKDNMIGWLAARSDLPDYGNLLVYKLPKEKLVYGPMQIEARVDQQTEISRELSLWGQRGSRVIRGNLLAIPIKETFIYVEPVYLEATVEKRETPAKAPAKPSFFGKAQGSGAPGSSRSGSPGVAALPELKRVIVAFSNRLVMEEDLDKALASVLGGPLITEPTTAAAAPITPGTMPKTGDGTNLGVQALEHYNRAQEYVRQGKWAEYGQELENLERVLKELARSRAERTGDQP